MSVVDETGPRNVRAVYYAVNTATHKKDIKMKTPYNESRFKEYEQEGNIFLFRTKWVNLIVGELGQM